MTDVVLRCEDYLPLGRTVFEGIYAGCMVLLPLRTEDDVNVEEIMDQIILYRARDVEDCIEQIACLYHTYKNGIYDNGFAPTSNVAVSASNLLHAIKS
jgi:hypothetical protein